MKTVAETKQTASGWSGSFNESDVVCVVSAFFFFKSNYERAA